MSAIAKFFRAIFGASSGSGRADFESVHDMSMAMIKELRESQAEMRTELNDFRQKLNTSEANSRKCERERLELSAELHALQRMLESNGTIAQIPNVTLRKQVLSMVEKGHISEAIAIMKSVLGDENTEYLSLSRRYHAYVKKINEGESTKELEDELTRICNSINQLMTE